MPPSPLSALPPDQLAAGQLALAVGLATAGFALLLPRPRGRRPAVGTFLAVAGLAAAAAFVAGTFGLTGPDVVEAALFWLFSLTAVAAGGVLVTQSNPARGAMAFAFVVLSTCGLFLLLAAPFLMAATVIIYMGAIVVTFLFVLMLSNAQGPSDENDRSREPVLGGLAGFGFTGLILFTLYAGSPAGGRDYPLPAAEVTADDKANLLAAADELHQAAGPDATPADAERRTRAAGLKLAAVVGYAPAETAGAGPGHTMQDRLRVAAGDARVNALLHQADDLRDKRKAALDALETALLDPSPDLAGAKPKLADLRGDALKLAGRGELPARNVSAVGLVLYAEHLVAVELAGTLLLVAAIGAVAVASRKGAAA